MVERREKVRILGRHSKYRTAATVETGSTGAVEICGGPDLAHEKSRSASRSLRGEIGGGRRFSHGERVG